MAKKGHLRAHRQHQRLEQEREAVGLTGPCWCDHARAAVGQTHTRRAHVGMALVHKDMQMPQALAPGIVRRMFAGRVGVGKPAAGSEVHADRQLLVAVWLPRYRRFARNMEIEFQGQLQTSDRS